MAFAALIVAVIAGAVPADDAFSGFGHPATVIIALVLVISRGLSHAGVIEYVARRVVDAARPLPGHIGLMAGVAAAMSAVMNNVAALALLMPIDLQAAAKAGRSPAYSLMPLSFATILGGMVTLIGTPPNIIVAEFRGAALGTSFGMFDFAPVGGVCAAAGVLFVALFGWRLIPAGRRGADATAELRALKEYITELRVPEESSILGKTVADLDEATEEHEVTLLGLVRYGRRYPGTARREVLRQDDILVIEGGPEGIDAFRGTLDLRVVEREDEDDDTLKERDFEMREVVAPQGAFIEGRRVGTLSLQQRYRVSLLGLSRQGERIRKRIGDTVVQAGDVLLLLGSGDNLTDATQRLGCLPLAERGLDVVQRSRAGLASGIFALAIILASVGLLPLPIALGAVVVLFVLFGIMPLRELYNSVEWSVIVLLGALIPIGQALETSGGTELIAGALVDASTGMPAWVLLTLLMLITMTLSDVMNNTAMAVVAAPIALEIAEDLEVSADPFLMAVAVAASCAFLTPIGHKNNVLIMGPGGYRFGDYWRMGLPLEILVVAVGVPMILLVWPL
ncbi:MAG: SLC13 family permease [Acuticoccus sp.]